MTKIPQESRGANDPPRSCWAIAAAAVLAGVVGAVVGFGVGSLGVVAAIILAEVAANVLQGHADAFSRAVTEMIFAAEAGDSVYVKVLVVTQPVGAAIGAVAAMVAVATRGRVRALGAGLGGLTGLLAAPVFVLKLPELLGHAHEALWWVVWSLSLSSILIGMILGAAVPRRLRRA